jgi:Icc-related predicted phosphoesterase
MTTVTERWVSQADDRSADGHDRRSTRGGRRDSDRRAGERLDGRDGAEAVDVRDVRVAAVGDIHFDTTRTGSLRDLFSDVHRNADVLALCGDLTTHGKPEQMKAFVGELAGVQVPIVAVLGNHDYESGQHEECTRVLCDAGVEVLDGTNTVIQGIGFAGTKGFAGGFGRGALGPFGEQLIKDFVNAAVDEALKLERALLQLRAETRLVLLHYAPIQETIIGEPEVIYPFLGSSRLLQPIETHGADAVFHGHAHHGVLQADTPGGIPVFNVALPLLHAEGLNFRIFTAAAPDRRGQPMQDSHAAQP